jgi:hypothetical protein
MRKSAPVRELLLTETVRARKEAGFHERPSARRTLRALA